MPAKDSGGDGVMDRCDDARPASVGITHGHARRKPSPNGRGDPVTSNRQYDEDELEFLKAIDAYQRHEGKKFPTWTEVMGIFRALGYAKQKPTSPSQ